MAWTTPTERATGFLVTAAVYNQDIIDNLLALAGNVCQVYMSSDVNHTASGSFQTMTWDSEILDPSGMHSPSVNPTRITAVTAGTYLAQGQVCFGTTTDGIGAMISKNGGEAWENRQASPNLNGNAALLPPTLIALAIGDYLEMAAFQQSGGNLAMRGESGSFSSFFNVAKVSPT